MNRMLVKSQIKYIQSLGQKKHRDEASVFIAEGPKLAKELLDEVPEKVKEIFALKEWIDNNRIIIKENNIKVNEIASFELEKISHLKTPNQLLLLVDQFDHKARKTDNGKWSLCLDDIQDPGNMGTIIRIADWFGLENIICSETCADIYNPKVVQSTMGSIVRVNIFYTDIAAWLAAQTDTRIYAAMLSGQSIHSVKYQKGGVLVIGNESKGISEEIQQLVNVKITIPQIGKAESLNAAVATGILLSHLIS